GGAILLGLASRRLSDANERRRIKILLAGLAAGALAVVLIVGDLVSQAFPALEPILAPLEWLRPAKEAMLFLVPASFAYAILKHRLFDVSVIVRQGLEYAAARGVLLSIVPGAATILLMDLGFHSSEPLVAILASR